MPMLMSKSTRPYLHVRRPSPTTVEFIVSSHPPPTLRRCALHAVHRAARLLLAVACVALLWLNLLPAIDDDNNSSITSITTNTTTPSHHEHESVPHLAHTLFFGGANEAGFHPLAFIRQAQALAHAVILSTPPTRQFALFAPTVSPWLAFTAAVGAVWLAALRSSATETLLVLRGLGIQVHGRFIPTDKILDVLINEAFLGFEVRYYLAVVVAGEDDIVVTFPTLLPGLDIVKTVWSGVRECLWEGDLVRRAGVDDETTSTTMTKH